MVVVEYFPPHGICFINMFMLIVFFCFVCVFGGDKTLLRDERRALHSSVADAWGTGAAWCEREGKSCSGFVVVVVSFFCF